MREHVHSGPFELVKIGVYSVIFWNILRLLAIGAANRPGLEWIAKMIGGAISFTATEGVS